MAQPRFKAVVLDLDGVVTHTARIHAAAWKRLFDEYNSNRAARDEQPFQPFDQEHDYLTYVDGKARQDGVHSFLASRGIELAIGNYADSPDRETCHGLGNRKDRYFKVLLEQQGPEVFEDAVTAINRWREQDLKTAVASSSRNCAEILRLAGLTQLFDVRVDGTHLQLWNLRGKPAPDLFLAAARELSVDPAEAIVVEDAISGIQAGRAGGFGLVVGVARKGDFDALKRAGADIVVAKLTDLKQDLKKAS